MPVLVVVVGSGDVGSDVVGSGSDVVVLVGRGVEVEDELVELEDEDEELVELDDEVDEELVELEDEDELDDELEDDEEVDVGSLVVGWGACVEVIGAGAFDGESVCGRYSTLPGGGSLVTFSPSSAPIM